MLCSVKLVKNMQVEQLCLLEAAYRAVEDAGIPIEQLRSTATGIFAAAYTPFFVSPYGCIAWCRPAPLLSSRLAYTETLTALSDFWFGGQLCPNAPDETNLRGSIMSTLADQVKPCVEVLKEPPYLRPDN